MTTFSYILETSIPAGMRRVFCPSRRLAISSSAAWIDPLDPMPFPSFADSAPSPFDGVAYARRWKEAGPACRPTPSLDVLARRRGPRDMGVVGMV